MNRLLLIILFTLHFLTLTSKAQSVSGTLTLNPYPSPYVSDWENNPSALGSLTLIKEAGRAYSIRINAVVRMQGRGEIFRSTTNPIELTSSSVQIINNTNLIQLSDASFSDKDYERKMRFTGRLLEGNYTACLTIENLQGVILANNICANFTILYPSAPQLIFPVNNDQLEFNNNYPTFQWTPVIVPPAYQIKYTLRLVEILTGQTPLQAINANVPVYQNNQITLNSLIYPIEALPITSGKIYAWQVQALDQYGLPATQNQGKSEIFIFTKKSDNTIVYQNPVSLDLPEANEVVKTKTPKFTWNYSTTNTAIKYNLRVVKVLQGQTLETAIKNYPILTKTLLSKYYQTTQLLPINPGETYAWRVVVLDPQGTDTLSKSEIRTFTSFPLALLLPSDNGVVNIKRPQFQWSYTGSSGKYYDLKIIKLPMFYYNQQGIIEESLFDDPQNVIYQKYNLSGAQLSGVNSNTLEVPLFKPDVDIPMEEAKSYYWQVSVKDQSFGTITGKSEIRKLIFNPYQPGFATNCNLNGKLSYEFAKPGEYIIWPLKNVNIKIVVKYMLKYTSYAGNIIYGNNSGQQGEFEVPLSSLPQQWKLDYNKTVGIGKTDSEGNFQFSFMNLKPMGVIDENFHFSAGTEFYYNYTGKLHRVLRLIVESPYYTSPDMDIILQPGDTKSIGQVVAYVRSYSLAVTVKSPGTFWNNQYLSANAPIGNMIVYILRKNKPGEVPENEGLPVSTIENESPYPGCYQSGFRVIGKSTTNSQGIAHFERLVKSIYSQNDEYFIYTIADSNSTSLTYRSFIPIKYKFINQSDNAVFNNQYSYPNISTQVVAIPINPFIKGTIKRNDITTGSGGNQPIADAQVKLLDWAVFWWQEEATTGTNLNGQFRFSNLHNVFDGNGKVTGPVRGLKITKYGFRDTSLAVKNGSILKPGESWSREILLEPESKVIGKIVNENGNGISAKVTLVSGETVNAIPPMIFILPGYKRAPANFELKAPKGPNKIIVDPVPFDNTYLKDTINFYISGSSYDAGTIIIKKALHRIRIFAGDLSKAQGEFFYITSKLPGSKVRLETSDGVLIDEKLSDQNGFAEFKFANTSSTYKITVVGPADKDFEITTSNITNVESKDWKTYYILLKPAAKISGYVFVGTQNQPVANARVTIKNSTNTFKPEAFTDNNGYYVLRNVPKVFLKLTASKKSSNLIGDETNWMIVSQNELSNINFNLKVYSDMDITHLLGFPVEVDNLVEENGEVKISGKLVDIDSLDNDLFSSSQALLNFSNISIVPDPNLTSVIFGVTVPVSKPKTLPLQTDANTLNLKIFDKYSGNMNDNKIGIELISGQTGNGVIKGKVKVSESSFNIASQNLKFVDNGFNLQVPNNNDQKISVITADKSLPYNTNKFNVVNSNGNKVIYKLFNFNSEASNTNSFLFKDSLVLNTVLHTQLEGITPADLNLNIGNIAITTSEVKPIINKTNKINLALGNWSIQIDKWSLNGVFSSSNATLKTGLVDLPISELNIIPDKLSYLKPNFNSMLLGGVAQLKVSGIASFGYESQGNTKWYLTVSKGTGNHAASFGGLPGMANGDSIFISSFSLYSDGTKNFTPNSTTLDIYKVGKLSLNQLIAGTNSIEMSSLYFDIPMLDEFNMLVKYYKENNNIKFKLVPVPMVKPVKGINLKFGADANTQPMTLDQNGLRVRGTVSEEDKFSFNAWLYHNIDSTSIWIETPNTPNSLSNQWQKQIIGGPLTYLEKIKGNMKVLNGNWQNLWYSGNLITPNGIDPNKNKLTFTVYGDIVASNQEIGVKHIQSPYGNIAITYEPENHRFIGSLSMDKDLGNAYVKGQASFIVDDEGWYFFSGGEMEVYNPYSKGSAGLLIGHHSITDEMKNTFKQFSYVYKHKGALPLTFPNSLSGFYFEGMTSIPIQSIIGLPNIDIDLVVVSARLWVNAGADIRMSTQFSNNNLVIGAGMDNFIDAGFSVSQWFVVECSKLSFGALLDIGSEGQFSTDGTWSAELTGDITLTGKAKVGWGVCDSDCEGKFCEEDSWSGSKMFGIKGHVGTDGKYMNFYSK